MKINACAVVMAVGAIFLPLKAEEIYSVEAGGVFEVTDDNNIAGNHVDFSGDATLKLSGTITDGVFPLKLNLNFVKDEVSTEKPAVLTVDVAGCTSVRMTGHIRNYSGGGKIALPQGVKLFEVGAATRSGDAHTDFTAFQSDVSFADADGCVKFVNDVSLANLPTCAYSIADGSRIATLGKEALGKGNFEVSTYDVEVCYPESFSDNATITVPNGKKLLVRPVRFSNANNGTWGGSPGSFNNNVVLGGVEAHIDFLNKNDITGFTGIISGSGDINLKGAGSVSFKGKLSYEGVLVAEKAPADGYTFNLESGSDVVPAVVANVTGTKFYIDPNAGDNGDKALSMNLFEAKDGVSEISVAANTELRIDEVVGGVRLSSSGDNASVQIVSLAAGAVLYVTPGVALTVESAAADAKVVFEADAQGNMDWSLSGPTSGEALKIAVEFPDGADSSAMLTLGGKVAFPVDNVLNVKDLHILSGAEITADIADGVSIHNKGGVLKQRSWKDKIALWVDASDASTITYAKTDFPEKESVIDANRISEWRDCRPDRQVDGALRFRLTAFDADSSIMKTDNQGGFPQYWNTEADYGKKCVRLTVNRSRMQIATGRGSKVPLLIKYAIFVFNSKDKGGGNAFFCNRESLLKRVASTTANVEDGQKPLIYSNESGKFAFRTNGVDVVSPTTTLTIGDWQIISIACPDGVEISNIGNAKDDNTASRNGGQIYAEIMLFSDMPTETERNIAETYLSKKWGLKLGCAETREMSASLSTVFGQGIVSLAKDTIISSVMFNGTVNLNGNRLEFDIDSDKLAFNESSIPSADRILWIDPSLEGAVVFGGDPAKPDEVKFIHSRDNAEILTGDKDRCVASPYSDGENRRVRLVKATKESGLVDSWLDFRNGYGDDGYRNHLQIKEYLSTPIPEKYNVTDEGFFRPVFVKAGFIALDSSLSGGSVILSTVGNASGFSHRTGNPSVTTPIWRDSCSEQVKNSDTYLDGQKVAATKNGYNGRPEILSFNMKKEDEPQDAKVFGYSGTGTATSSNYEIMGEWILYSKTLDDDTRRGIEAYLMWKWLGKRLDGYSDFRGMTVVGDGVLAAAGPEYLPKLTDEFTGSLEFSRTEWEFTLPKNGGSAAVDAVDLSGREVALPTAITVKINGKGAANGTYSLFKASKLKGVETIAITDDSSLGGKYVTLLVSADEISVRIQSRGLKMVIR